MDSLYLFHPVIREWFEGKFSSPTEAQASGWPAIAQGRHTLISAPTGSGKTLAAFLFCIDRLLRAGIENELPERTQVLYVSPLKALSNDIHSNLSIPLQEILHLARHKGLTVPEIRIALRTGDTPARERRARARKPPHLWITTPESLYILLTSESGRRGLSEVGTLIIDEIHSIVGNKRGAHLSLSVERLCALVRRPVTRIGLSATVHPLEEVARFLVGSSRINPDGLPDCTIVSAGHFRRMDLQLELPGVELGPMATTEVWEGTVSRIGDLVREHHSTLVFVNTRRLAERVAHQLSRKVGEENVVAHHGSLSRRTRLKVEERLKKGEVRACVATSSLELGIDIGSVDLVCQIGSPRSINGLLQRIGRSGHQMDRIPKGRIFPLTRDELIECAALIYGIRRGELDRLGIPPWPLDILSQQIVAMCAVSEWKVEDLFRLIRKAYPYRELPRDFFDRVLHMLSHGISPRLGRKSAYLYHDVIHGTVSGRRGARLAAITSGGAIPDTADYEVVAQPEGIHVGNVNEEFALESMSGDVFVLGNTSWRIRHVEKGKVIVEDARGQTPNVPFWRGEAPARTDELSRLVSEIREGIDQRLHDHEACLDWLGNEIGMSFAAAQQAYAYIKEGKRVLGSVPVELHVVAERFFDEIGGVQLVIHAPFGARINKAWGLALRMCLLSSCGSNLQASATDDGIHLAIGSERAFPFQDLFQYLRSGTVEEILKQAVCNSPIFITRWRWTVSRSLALLRFAGGKRVPAQIMRIRSEDLLAAIMPAAVSDKGNLAAKYPAAWDHPLLFETLRDCLQEAMDLEGLRSVLRRIEQGRILVSGKDTPIASVFAHQILNAMPYAFLDDAPLEERRARAVLLRRALPESAADLGSLSPEAIRSAAEDAWPDVRDADELHDALMGLILFPQREIGRFPKEAELWIDLLKREGRIIPLEIQGRSYWAAAECRNLVFCLADSLSALYPHREAEKAATFAAIVRGWLEVSGPLTASHLADVLGLPLAEIEIALRNLEGEGLVLRGFFSDCGMEEFCNRRILARIHRATIAQLRREVDPVPVATFLRFLFEWQHVAPAAQLAGEMGLLEVIEQLQGFETAAVAWENEILRTRISDYQPEFLDNLCLGGEIVWGRWKQRQTQAEVPARRPGLTRTAPVGLALRENLRWLLDKTPADEMALSVPARKVLNFLRQHGASFFPEIVAGTGCLGAEAEDALWQLVAAGLVTADSFSALRSLVSGDNKRLRHPRRRRLPRRTREGRWSLLEASATTSEDKLEFLGMQYVRRYGILGRELLAREPAAPLWRDLVKILRRAEARGQIRGGRFIAGLNGEQFALPEAVQLLRKVRQTAAPIYYIKVSSCDPLNLVGILTPGARVPAVPGNKIIYRNGIPIVAFENGNIRILTDIENGERAILDRLLDQRPALPFVVIHGAG